MENLKLNDIAGYQEEKNELMQIIAMFRDFQTYCEKGVYLPKGLIISGTPGVGKTLFAKVLANEVNAPFYYVDGSEYSAIRGVRKLKSIFAKARKNSPSVVFIDELNTFVGGDDYQSDYTKRNLSALLKLIDGIKNSEGVFVIGASSDKDDLDDAVVRSGRMDKHICLNSPNYASRLEMLNYYLSKVSLDTSKISKKLVAEKTQYFNGADIKTLVNEAMQECIYKNVPPTDDVFLQHIRKIEEQDIDREKDERDLALLAYHDLGHLLVADALFGKYDDLSIAFESNNGNSSIRSLLYSDDYDEENEDEEYDDDDDEESGDDEEDDAFSTDSKSALLDKVCTLLGGAAAEEIFLQQRYLTSTDDVETAFKLIGTAFAGALIGFEYINLDTYHYMEASQKKLEKLEDKREQILTEQYERAKDIIAANSQKLIKVHAALLKKKTLAAKEIKLLLTSDCQG